MIVVARIHIHATDAEELLKHVEHVDASRALCDHEIMRDLKAGSVAFSVHSIRLTGETDGEATFSVYETSNPSGSDESFLLIVWLPFENAAKFVTAHPCGIGEYLRMRQVFQQIVGFL